VTAMDRLSKARLPAFGPNRFVARIAYIALPASKTLDVNYLTTSAILLWRELRPAPVSLTLTIFGTRARLVEINLARSSATKHTNG